MRNLILISYWNIDAASNESSSNYLREIGKQFKLRLVVPNAIRINAKLDFVMIGNSVSNEEISVVLSPSDLRDSDLVCFWLQSAARYWYQIGEQQKKLQQEQFKKQVKVTIFLNSTLDTQPIRRKTYQNELARTLLQCENINDV